MAAAAAIVGQQRQWQPKTLAVSVCTIQCGLSLITIISSLLFSAAELASHTTTSTLAQPDELY